MAKKTLVIVESPTKAKTISRFLSKDYIVKSSFGHIRDLPKSKLGIDVDNNFEPTYTVPAKSKKVIAELRKAKKNVEEVILATDEDREGEAIAFHLAHLLKIDPKKSKRIVFHEITKSAITKALENPRTVNMNLVDAQQARRVLDRIVGYKLSPFLWKKIRYGLSAGRVQSVAVRLIVERERERDAFKPEEYWSIEGQFKKDTDDFSAKLNKVDGKTLRKLSISTKEESDKLLKGIKENTYQVDTIEKKEKKRTPPPPFITSTLQRTASSRLGFTSKRTMMVAQKLYEGINLGDGQIGLITYMRTDSTNLSKQALEEAQSFITSEYGEEFALEKPRFYRKKSKGAQEAHEAIRPTSFHRTPESIKEFLDASQYKLYKIIWQRALASQMKEALLDATRIDILSDDKKFNFRATGSIVTFIGYGRAYTGEKALFDENELPELSQGDVVDLNEIKADQHFTEPPPRYNEASLIKTLEEKGIGRPSTYAPTIATIENRGYVHKEDRRFFPTETGILVTDVLVKHFPQTSDYDFTAEIENDLDKIAHDEKEWVPMMKDFYTPFMENLKKKDKEVSKKELTEEKTDEKCEKCGKPMIIKMGRFGKFMACSDYPECKNTKPLGDEKKLQEEFSGEKCDKCDDGQMTLKRGRFGPFLGCSNYPDCKNIKKIEKKTGATCPECDKGEIVEKKSKKGRVFYACNRYPDCKHAMWQKPTGETCPQCKKSLLVHAKKGVIACSDKECDYIKEQEE